MQTKSRGVVHQLSSKTGNVPAGASGVTRAFE